MPLYDYDCAACGRRFEVIHGVHADPPATCPLCGSGPVRKAISAANVHYKGSGWAKKERRAVKAGSSSGKGDEGSSDGGSDASDTGSSNDGSSSDRGETPATTTAKAGESSSSEGPKPAASSKTPAKTSD